jgi:hypothetical protein
VPRTCKNREERTDNRMIDVSYSFNLGRTGGNRKSGIHISREDRVVPILSHYSGKQCVRKLEVEHAEERIGWEHIYRERP